MVKTVKPRYEDDTVLDILRREKIYLSADCGGRGECGKCRVRFTDPASCPVPDETEEKLIPQEDLARGIRLACRHTTVKERTDIEIPSSSLISEGSAAEPDIKKIEELSASEIIAVDYGTTMISGAVVDLNRGVVSEASVINHQKAYGADVLSRIRASIDGCGEEMRKISRDDLSELSVRLGRDPERARYIISGNTAMEHLISGFPVKGLGEYPYTPVDISLRRDGNFTFLPGVSAFVGADIVSGICACSLDRTNAPWLYADIGTNGEMALGCGDDVLACSAPAGPAFEGGGISCGMPAVTGAVKGAVITGGKASVITVNEGLPCGICGSGIIDIIAGCLRNGIIDRNGTFTDDYIEEGFRVYGDITVTQKDVREIQKAKAAIRAGMETLISESGISRKEIKKLVIAGDFGDSIDMENAARAGLIPEDLLGVCGTAGNASLSGATLYALDTGFSARLQKFAEKVKVIEVSETPEFPARYVSYMVF